MSRLKIHYARTRPSVNSRNLTLYYALVWSRQRLNYPELKRTVIELFRKFDPSKLLIEDKASGISLVQELQGEGVYCIDSYKPEPGRDKYVRLAEQSIKFENGRVSLPSQAPWLDEYVREITGFPGSKHDDQVDSTTLALESLGSLASFAGRKPWIPWRWGRETC